MIAIIAARTKNNVIGSNGKIPWNLPNDLKHFKELTKGNIVIMGRNTYESIGNPLPMRLNIVVSSTLKSNGYILVAKSLEEAIIIASKFRMDIFLIGGYKIYEEGLKYADKLYITEVDTIKTGDTVFPEFDVTKYTKNIIKENFENDIHYTFTEYTK